MTYWFNLMIENERRRQEAARAAEHRHQKRTLPGAGSRGDFLRSRGDFLRSRYELFLASLGHRLVVWGHHLQKRYERFSETAPFGAEQLDFVSEPNVDSSNGARSR